MLAGRGEWVTNAKTLLYRANLRDLDELISGLTASPPALRAVLDAAETRLTSAS